MPDADLPPILLTEEFVEQVRDTLPLLPDYIVSMLLGGRHSLRADMAKRLSVNPDELQYYSKVMEKVETGGVPVYNWIRWLGAMLKEKGIKGIGESPFGTDQMVDLVSLVRSDDIDSKPPLPPRSHSSLLSCC